ncbi:MAG: diadenylate cyclase CdaA [Evtepia sp.]
MDTILQWAAIAVGYLRLLTISDLVDIVIISFVIYKGMTFLRKSSAAQVAKALLLIVAALWVSYQCNLHVINFILGKTMELGLLALMIVFQPEIRRFLEQMGSHKLGYLFSSEATVTEIENAITETVSAYTVLSKDKVGALTVFERKHLLNNVIASGTVLDASVSSELMKNIFYPKAPLHDGAVVIRAGRVAGAACMLPLSSNMNLSRDLGMRHRAGIGMSENSDAVVAIVSEETGAISVAVNGTLKRHLAPETLERLLRNELVPKPKNTQKSIKKKMARMFRKWGRS